MEIAKFRCEPSAGLCDFHSVRHHCDVCGTRDITARATIGPVALIIGAGGFVEELDSLSLGGLRQGAASAMVN